METERPRQRPCSILGQLKLTTIHIAGCSLQKPDVHVRTSKNIPLCFFGTCLVFMGRLLNMGKRTEFSYLYTASVRCPITFSPQFVNVQEEAACQAQRSPSALQLFQLLLPRPGFLLSAACPSLPLGSFLTRAWFCLFS